MTDTRRQSTGRWRRRARGAGIAIALVVLGATIALQLLRRELDERLLPRTAEMRTAQRLLTEPRSDQPINLLLLGSDHRRSTGTSVDRRSDAIMLVRLDSRAGLLRIASLPRDLSVAVPGVGETKINDAFAVGGAPLALETVADATGLELHALAVIDFTGFRGIIDDLGGVWVDVDRRYRVPPGRGYEALDLQPGFQRLGGDDALDFARFRRDRGGDALRVVRQQRVVDAVRARLADGGRVQGARRALDLVTVHADVVVGGPDGGRLRLGVLDDLVRAAVAIDSGDVERITYRGPTQHVSGGTTMPWDPDAMADMIADFAGPRQDRTSSIDRTRHAGGSAPKAELVAAPTYRRQGSADAVPPLLVPAVMPFGSAIERVRTYRLAPGDGPDDAYRIEIRFGDVTWGVQGARFVPKAFRDQTSSTTRGGGRTYELVGDDGFLHRLAWREHGSTYWIVNSLQNDIPALHMHMIADSMEPLDH